MLPSNIVVPEQSLALFRAYRCYLAHNAEACTASNLSLGSDLSVKTFLRVVNLGSFHRRLADLWNTQIE
jgi:hypothetical protein